MDPTGRDDEDAPSPERVTQARAAADAVRGEATRTFDARPGAFD